VRTYIGNLMIEIGIKFLRHYLYDFDFECCAHIAGSTSSSESLDKAQAWLKDCLDGHPEKRDDENVYNCKPHQGPSFTPSRLIYIGSNENELRLLEKNIPRRDYLALSYCWGSGTALKTTSSTLDAFKAGIPWISLPQTIKDAILVTRYLKVRYLWVDSIVSRLDPDHLVLN